MTKAFFHDILLGLLLEERVSREDSTFGRRNVMNTVSKTIRICTSFALVILGYILLHNIYAHIDAIIGCISAYDVEPSYTHEWITRALIWHVKEYVFVNGVTCYLLIGTLIIRMNARRLSTELFRLGEEYREA
ncbi:MAG: hypothetical protein ABIG66_02310 [Candidatus Kerfeldbacteria bacterium]